MANEIFSVSLEGRYDTDRVKFLRAEMPDRDRVPIVLVLCYIYKTNKNQKEKVRFRLDLSKRVFLDHILNDQEIEVSLADNAHKIADYVSNKAHWHWDALEKSTSSNVSQALLRLIIHHENLSVRIELEKLRHLIDTGTIEKESQMLTEILDSIKAKDPHLHDRVRYTIDLIFNHSIND